VNSFSICSGVILPFVRSKKQTGNDHPKRKQFFKDDLVQNSGRSVLALHPFKNDFPAPLAQWPTFFRG
jgi:hypothetical protein